MPPARVRTAASFALLGLTNNILYVLILSAALDLVGPSIPKGLVLLADVVPSFGVKLILPYFIHRIGYATRVTFCVIASGVGMGVVALSGSAVEGRAGSDPSAEINGGGGLGWTLLGIVLASLSSGIGEASFLGLTSFYDGADIEDSDANRKTQRGKGVALASWGSGTGAAGLVGAGAYALATGPAGLSVRTTLLVSALLPGIMVLAFFVILPKVDTSRAKGTVGRSKRTDSIDPDDDEDTTAREGLLAPTTTSNPDRQLTDKNAPLSQFKHNLLRARALFLPYMLPLLLVYIAEYTINQGVASTLLFPLPSSPFKAYRDFYPAYQSLYQAGVFISRSSTPFVRIHNLYLPSLLQIANLALLVAQSMFDIFPSVYLVFLVVFWEGLLGGAVYVNTFAEIMENVDERDREFSLSATTVSDSAGICVAGVVSMGVEVALCRWQVERLGRPWCREL